MKHLRSGFSLVEIMVAIAIMAILTAVAIPNYIAYRRSAQARACKANLSAIRSACEAYVVRYNEYPRDSEWEDLCGKAGDTEVPFLRKPPVCPYGKECTYTFRKIVNEKGLNDFEVKCSSHDENKHKVNDEED